MIGMSHIILHAAMCARIARLAPDTPVNVNIQLVDRTGRERIQKSLRVERGDGSTLLLEFDAPQGIFQMQMVAPKYGCTGMDYWALLPEHNRSINGTLVQGVAPQPQPMLLQGTAPPSFLYVAPTFVLFPSATQCNKPVEDPLPSNIQVENDQDAFYVWLFSQPQTARESQMIVFAPGNSDGRVSLHQTQGPVPGALGWMAAKHPVQRD